MKRRYTVTIPRLEFNARVLAESPREAIQRAVVRNWGRRAWWWGPTLDPWRVERNGYEYGQVVESLFGDNTNTCRTGQVCVEVSLGW